MKSENNMNNKRLSLFVLVLAFMLSLTGCGIASEVINHEANDQRLLKAGALDLPVSDVYIKYQYSFLNKYQITHDFILAGGCTYNVGGVGIKDVPTGSNYVLKRAPSIFERDEHTYVSVFQTKDVNQLNPRNIDRYVRPEFDRGLDPYGNPLPKGKGFQPMCFESWGGTSHVLAIKLYKKDIATWKSDLSQVNPNGKFTEETINGNKWLVQTNDIAQRALNGTGGAYLHYSTAIGNTGYTLTIQLGANQDSLKYPQAHAQMKAIFKHLIESVKIEQIKP